MSENSAKNQLIMADVIAKTWNDPAFKADLINNPKSLLQEAGVAGITDGINIKVLENSDTLKHIVLPPEESVEDLKKSVGDFVTGMLPLPAGLEMVLVQNSSTLANIVLPVAPTGHQGKLDSSHAQVLASAGYEAINLYTTANAVAEANAAAVQNVAAVTEGAAAAVALVVIAAVI